LAVEQLGILEDAIPADVAEKIRATNPYWIRYMEMEESFDDPDEPTLPPLSPLPKGEGRGRASEHHANTAHPDA